MPRIKHLSRIRISNQRVINAVEVVLVVALAIFLSDLVWALVPSPSANGVHVERLNPAGSSKVKPQAGRQSLSARAPEAVRTLFGVADKTANNTSSFTGEAIRETDLNLTLKGILADRQTKRKLALIANSNQKEKVYWLGDSINGAEIVRIEAGRVVLRRNGNNEALSLKATTNQKEFRNKIISDEPGGSSIQRISKFNRHVQREKLEHHLKDLPALLKQAKTVPYTEDGKSVGFRITQIPNNSVFRELGLKQADVIRAINGNSVRTGQEVLQAYKNLRTVTAFSLDVLRDGRDITLDYSIQ